MLSVVALVGRPNVGKSTLFNVLTRSRDALVADVPGVTRDRHYGTCHLGKRSFLVIDTGGLSGVEDTMDVLTARQVRLAIEEAQVLVFVVDARDGLLPQDIVRGSIDLADHQSLGGRVGTANRCRCLEVCGWPTGRNAVKRLLCVGK